MVESVTIKNGVYLLMLLLTWIAACVVFGGELHIGKSDGGNTSFYQNHAVTGGSSTDYSNCSGTLCDKCKSGGGGAVAMAVFFFLTTMTSIILRALAMAGKHTVVPSIGENEAKYASVEKIFNYVTLGFWFLCIIIWGATCISETNKLDGVSVQPTGYVYVVLCVICIVVAIILLPKIHDESGFGSGTGSKQQQQQQQQHAQAQASYPTPAEQQPPQDNATTQV